MNKFENRFTYGRTCVYNINYHIVWCVQYRNKVLTAPIEAYLKEALTEIAAENGFTVVQTEVDEMDHIHCFVSAPPKLSVTFIVKHLKGTSAIRLFRRFPELRTSLPHGQLWNGSYYVESIGSTSVENIKRYIAHQAKVFR
ncbi:MAG: IS200/IS605 family transposase [Lachnospiraceae bacterium]